jgi:hypothetical protein
VLNRPDDRRFMVFCCGKRRGVFPGGVLVCPNCDFDHASATVMPNERYARDVPPGQRMWEVPRAAEG